MEQNSLFISNVKFIFVVFLYFNANGIFVNGVHNAFSESGPNLSNAAETLSNWTRDPLNRQIQDANRQASDLIYLKQ